MSGRETNFKTTALLELAFVVSNCGGPNCYFESFSITPPRSRGAALARHGRMSVK